MKTLRSILMLVLLVVGARALADETKIVTPDTYTDLGIGPPLLAGWTSAFLGGQFAPPAALLGNRIEALHRMESPGQWLLSLNDTEPTALITGGVCRQELILYDALGNGGAGSYSRFFCLVEPDVDCGPTCEHNLNTAYLVGGDDGDLVLGFDVQVDAQGVSVLPTDLVRFNRTSGPDCGLQGAGGSTCCHWQAVATLEFNSAGHNLSGTGIAGATAIDGGIALAFKSDAFPQPSNPARVCSDFGNPCTSDANCTTGEVCVDKSYKKGELVKWDSTTFTLFDTLGNWDNSQVTGLTLPPPTCSDLVGDPDDAVVTTCSASWNATDGVKHYRVEWQAENGAAYYDIYRGLLSELGSTGFSPSCVSSQLKDVQYVDMDPAPTNDGYYYVVAASNSSPPLGMDSSGPRPNPNPCP